MPTVYKYCGEHGLNILKNLELKITPVDQFNDPFEFEPYVICSNPKTKAESLIEPQDIELLSAAYETEKANGTFNGSFSEFKDRYIHTRAIPAIEDVAVIEQRCYQKWIAANYGVLVFVKRKYISIVMWGHYGNEHRGLVIGFDGSHSFFQGGAGLCSVKYVKERVTFDISWENGGEREREYARSLLFSKNEEWIYESEVRQMFFLRDLVTKRIRDEKTGNEMIRYFSPIPPEIIVSVSLGVKCSPELEKQVKTALQDKCFSHVKCDRAQLHRSKFELSFE